MAEKEPIEGASPPPQVLLDLPPHVRLWLGGITKERIQRFEKWEGVVVWMETTGKFTKALALAAMFVFGMAVTISSGWESVSKWFKGG